MTRIQSTVQHIIVSIISNARYTVLRTVLYLYEGTWKGGPTGDLPIARADAKHD